MERSTRHRCPLFDEELGIGPDIICIDTLHTMNPGPWMTCCKNTLWRLLDKNVYRIEGAAEKVRLEGVLRLRNPLFAHFQQLPPEERE